MATDSLLKGKLGSPLCFLFAQCLMAEGWQCPSLLFKAVWGKSDECQCWDGTERISLNTSLFLSEKKRSLSLFLPSSFPPPTPAHLWMQASPAILTRDCQGSSEWFLESLFCFNFTWHERRLGLGRLSILLLAETGNTFWKLLLYCYRSWRYCGNSYLVLLIPSHW